MRKTAIVALVMCSLFAFGQKQPQWRVVQSVILTHQTAAIPQTTVFTPRDEGLYRLNAYISARELGNGTEWVFGFLWTDLVGQNPMTASISAVRGGAGTITLIFSARRNTPVSFQVQDEGTPPNSHYTLAFTIEQLK
jgi:hypothetical protein